MKISVGNVVRFVSTHGLVLEGEVLETTEVACRVWTPVCIHIVLHNEILKIVNSHDN